jgi:ABC-type sulfate transport system substrate-binding protein
MEYNGRVKGVVQYARNNLEIMVPAGNPKGIQSLKDLGRGEIRLSMPNPVQLRIGRNFHSTVS